MQPARRKGKSAEKKETAAERGEKLSNEEDGGSGGKEGTASFPLLFAGEDVMLGCGIFAHLSDGPFPPSSQSLSAVFPWDESREKGHEICNG